MQDRIFYTSDEFRGLYPKANFTFERHDDSFDIEIYHDPSSAAYFGYQFWDGDAAKRMVSKFDMESQDEIDHLIEKIRD